MNKNPILMLLALSLIGCTPLTDVANNARNNAKPAQPPVVIENPISTAQWPDAPNSLFVTRPDFTVQLVSSLFNELSVTYGGENAVELPRGSMPYRPIDKTALTSGKVYFRLTTGASDANAQTQGWLMEIIDLKGVLPAFPQAVMQADLVIKERSINPRYAGTADEFNSSTTHIIMDPQFVQPTAHGGVSQCRVRFVTGTSLPTLSPGDTAHYPLVATGCRWVSLTGSAPGTQEVLWQLPSTAQASQTIDMAMSSQASINVVVTLTGYDQLKRRSFVRFNQRITSPTPPPACNVNNGFGGQKGDITYCASCDDDVRVNATVNACDDTEARPLAEDLLTKAGGKNCSLKLGTCTVCETSSSNPQGVLQPLPYCLADPDSEYGYIDVKDGFMPACTQDQVESEANRVYPGYEYEASLKQSFNVCATCAGTGAARLIKDACTKEQAVKMVERDLLHAGQQSCTVKICP